MMWCVTMTTHRMMPTETHLLDKFYTSSPSALNHLPSSSAAAPSDLIEFKLHSHVFKFSGVALFGEVGDGRSLVLV